MLRGGVDGGGGDGGGKIFPKTSKLQQIKFLFVNTTGEHQHHRATHMTNVMSSFHKNCMLYFLSLSNWPASTLEQIDQIEVKHSTNVVQIFQRCCCRTSPMIPLSEDEKLFVMANLEDPLLRTMIKPPKDGHSHFVLSDLCTTSTILALNEQMNSARSRCHITNAKARDEALSSILRKHFPSTSQQHNNSLPQLTLPKKQAKAIKELRETFKLARKNLLSSHLASFMASQLHSSCLHFWSPDRALFTEDSNYAFVFQALHCLSKILILVKGDQTQQKQTLLFTLNNSISDNSLISLIKTFKKTSLTTVSTPVAPSTQLRLNTTADDKRCSPRCVFPKCSIFY